MSIPLPYEPDDRSVLALVRHYAQEGQEGCLEVLRGPYRGLIFFQAQRLIHAEYLGKKGLSALYELLPWDESTFLWYKDLRPSAPSFALTMADLEAAESPLATTAEEPVRTDFPPLTPGSLPSNPAQDQQRLQSLYHQDVVSNILGQHIISLDWDDAPGGPQTFRFEGKEQSGCVIGTGEDCQFIINHPSIEPLHCSLMIRGDYVEIWDLGTAEKTRVNGVVVEQAVLTSGDTLLLGDVEMRFTLRIRRKFGNDEDSASTEQTIPSPAKSSPGSIPRKAISYATLGAPPPPKPGVVKALRKLLFRTTNRVRVKKS
jgi:hypothetical protein